VGTLLGPSVGLVEPTTGTLIGNWLAFPGQLFLATIQMIVIPLHPKRQAIDMPT